MIALFLYSDSLLAYKSTILTCFGLFILSLLNILFKDPRPFWTSDLISENAHCFFDFGSPDTELFILTFFYSYIIIMYRFKFAPEYQSTALTAFLISLLLLCIAGAYFSGVVNGVTYIY